MWNEYVSILPTRLPPLLFSSLLFSLFSSRLFSSLHFPSLLFSSHHIPNHHFTYHLYTPTTKRHPHSHKHIFRLRFEPARERGDMSFGLVWSGLVWVCLVQSEAASLRNMGTYLPVFSDRGCKYVRRLDGKVGR